MQVILLGMIIILNILNWSFVKLYISCFDVHVRVRMTLHAQYINCLIISSSTIKKSAKCSLKGDFGASGYMWIILNTLLIEDLFDLQKYIHLENNF